MAYTYLAHVKVGSADLNTVTTGAIDTSGADILIAYIAEIESATDATLTDSKTNTWAQLTERKDAGVSLLGRMFYAKNATVGSGHTFTVTSSNGAPAICVAAFSGSHLTAPLDQQNGVVDVDAGLSNITGSITPSEDNCLVITGLGFTGNSATITIDGSYAITDQIDYAGATNKGAALAYAIQTSLAASNRTWTYSTNEYAVTTIASFKASAGGGGGGTPTRDLTTLLCGQ